MKYAMSSRASHLSRLGFLALSMKNKMSQPFDKSLIDQAFIDHGIIIPSIKTQKRS